MKTNLDPHEIAQTAYALGEEFSGMVDSETRNKYAMDTGNGYTGLISLMAEAATVLEQTFEDFRSAGREYGGVFLYEAVPNMASNIAGFLALHHINDLTASELRKLADAAIAEDLVPIVEQIDTDTMHSDTRAKQNDTKMTPTVNTMPGVVFLRQLEEDVIDAIQRAIGEALRGIPGFLTKDHFAIDVEGIQAQYDLARCALVFESGTLYGVSSTTHSAGREVGIITSGDSGRMSAYGPPEGWLNGDAWASAFRNENGSYGIPSVPKRLRNLATEVENLLRDSGGPEPVSDRLGCSASHVTELMAKLADVMEASRIHY